MPPGTTPLYCLRCHSRRARSAPPGAMPSAAPRPATSSGIATAAPSTAFPRSAATLMASSWCSASRSRSRSSAPTSSSNCTASTAARTGDRAKLALSLSSIPAESRPGTNRAAASPPGSPCSRRALSSRERRARKLAGVPLRCSRSITPSGRRRRWGKAASLQHGQELAVSSSD